jgi:hypothetical protein
LTKFQPNLHQLDVVPFHHLHSLVYNVLKREMVKCIVVSVHEATSETEEVASLAYLAESDLVIKTWLVRIHLMAPSVVHARLDTSGTVKGVSEDELVKAIRAVQVKKEESN